MNGHKIIIAPDTYVHWFKNQKMKIHDCNAKIYSVDSVFGTAWFQIISKLSNASPASKYAQKKSALFENKR